MANAGQRFEVWSWSPDGRQLAGRVRAAPGNYVGLATYHFAAQKFDRLTDSGNAPVWLQDSRRLIFDHQGKLYLLDSQTRKSREILAVPPHFASGAALSRDDRLIYFLHTATEADIWLLSLDGDRK